MANTVEGEGILPAKSDSESLKPKEIDDLLRRPGTGELRLAHTEQFSGPVPHPRILAEYERLMPGAADRIFQMAEKQQEHRQGLEQSVIESDIDRADLGLKLGFILFLVLGIGAIVLFALGKEVGAYSLLVPGLGGGAAAIIRVGRERQKESQQDKQKPLLNRAKKRQHSRK